MLLLYSSISILYFIYPWFSIFSLQTNLYHKSTYNEDCVWRRAGYFWCCHVSVMSTLWGMPYMSGRGSDHVLWRFHSRKIIIWVICDTLLPYTQRKTLTVDPWPLNPDGCDRIHTTHGDVHTNRTGSHTHCQGKSKTLNRRWFTWRQSSINLK